MDPLAASASSRNLVHYSLKTIICREGDEFVGPFVAKLEEEVPEARVTTEIGEEGSTEESAHQKQISA